jgi:hypothetical protein
MPRFELPDVRGEARDTFVTPAPVNLTPIQQQLDTLTANMPQAATNAPPPVQVDSAQGAGVRYAREDHTHESRLQARRIQVTPDASGQYTYTFPRAYGTGIVPIVQVTCETPAGQSFRYDAGILQGSTTATQTTIVITKTNQNVITGLLNAVLAVFTPATSALWINIMSRAPS